MGELTITPIERIELQAIPLAAGAAARASKRPVALLLQRGEQSWRIELPEGIGE